MAATDGRSPRLLNYYLRWELTEPIARELSQWDVVVLDMEDQIKHPDLLRKMREWHPGIKLLVYITPQDIRTDAASNSYTPMRNRLASRMSDAWYIRNTTGDRLTWWPGTWLLNVTDKCPVVNGKRWQDTLVTFVSQDLLGSGLWDGVFYDNAWDSIVHFTSIDIDFDRNGVRDASPDADWKAGMRFIYQETRRQTGNRYVIVGNGTTRAYSDVLNGLMLENFVPGVPWPATMETYRFNERTTLEPRLNLVNANTRNLGGEANYRQMRFGLASTLMYGGYYSFDYGDQDHSQRWHYDEYGVDLGAPVSDAVAASGKINYTLDVWQRQFTNGLAVVNGTPDQRTVDLGGEYEKIRGVQDPSVNDGSIVSELTVAPYDGQVLLKTFAKADDLVYPNGAFLRFFHVNGTRARNGFFAFEEGQRGGDFVARIDLNNNGARDLFVVSGNKLLAWRDDGQPYMAVYPYTAQYAGELRVAVGDLDADGKLEVVVGPGPGYKAPIKVYSYDGVPLKEDWYPFGTAYKSGYSLGIGNLGEPGGGRQIVVSMGKGTQPIVTTFSSTYKKLRSWFAYESWFRGGVSVATGDVNGDGIDEIVTGPGPGKKPVVRVFNRLGKQIVKEFTAFTAIGTPGATVGTADVDFDGKKEIVTMSKDVGQ